jgi:hypothetical protein
MKIEIELDALNELRDKICQLEYALANQNYHGNSIEYIHHKMTNYGNQLGLLGPFLKDAVRDGRLVLRNTVEIDQRVAKMLDIGETR